MEESVTPSVSYTKAGRIEVVDSLRGFAVFGILVSHCSYLFFLGDPTQTSPTDEAVSLLVKLFVNDKFYSLFSFLFGLSFSLMLTRTNESASVFYQRFGWRLLLLGIIGLLHNLHWNDDILSIYAFLGFILLPVSTLSNKVVFVLAIILLLNLPSLYIERIQTPLSEEEKTREEEQATKTYDTFYSAMQHGTYFETVKANLSTYPYKLQYYLYSGRFSFMLGFFFLGLIAGRRKLFHYFKEKKVLFKKIFRQTGSIASILTVLALLHILYNTYMSPALNSYSRYLMQAQSIFLTITYASGMSLFFGLDAVQWISKQFAMIGKMALTNYVLHSVLGTILLCGYGFGLINYPISIAFATLCSLPIFVLMIWFSHYWLDRYAYGPLEWIWRSATYLQLLPLKKQKRL